MSKEKPKIKARHAAELIKGMGGGEVVVVAHQRGEVTVAALAATPSVGRAQAEAEALLADIKRKYKIVPDRYIRVSWPCAIPGRPLCEPKSDLLWLSGLGLHSIPTL
jgi:hypothetical protein